MIRFVLVDFDMTLTPQPAGLHDLKDARQIRISGMAPANASAGAMRRMEWRIPVLLVMPRHNGDFVPRLFDEPDGRKSK